MKALLIVLVLLVLIMVFVMPMVADLSQRADLAVETAQRIYGPGATVIVQEDEQKALFD